jgi:hypothetical protein
MNGFIPYSIDVVDRRALVRWVEARADQPPSPFFAPMVQGLLASGMAQRITSLDALLDAPDLDPVGLVLHQSRCGSTLVTQTLAESGVVASVSEATPINQLLLLERLTADDRSCLLRGLVRTLLLPPLGAEARPGLVKFTSWNTLCFSVIRAAFPNTPWLFVYRDPLEVLASHAKHPARWIGQTRFLERLPNGQALAASIAALDDVRRCAALIAAFGQAVLTAHPLPAQLLNYNELPGALPVDVPSRFGLSLSTTQRDRVAASSALYSKDATRRRQFDRDAERRERPPTEVTRAADLEYSRNVHNALEIVRSGASAS